MVSAAVISSVGWLSSYFSSQLECRVSCSHCLVLHACKCWRLYIRRWITDWNPKRSGRISLQWIACCLTNDIATVSLMLIRLHIAKHAAIPSHGSLTVYPQRFGRITLEWIACWLTSHILQFSAWCSWGFIAAIPSHLVYLRRSGWITLQWIVCCFTNDIVVHTSMSWSLFFTWITYRVSTEVWEDHLTVDCLPFDQWHCSISCVLTACSVGGSCSCTCVLGAEICRGSNTYAALDVDSC